MWFIGWILFLAVDNAVLKTIDNLNHEKVDYSPRKRCNRTLTKNCLGLNFKSNHLYRYGSIFKIFLPEIDVYLECNDTNPYIEIYLNEDLALSTQMNFFYGLYVTEHVGRKYWSKLYSHLFINEQISEDKMQNLLDHLELILGNYAYVSGFICESIYGVISLNDLYIAEFNETDTYFSKYSAQEYQTEMYYVSLYGEKAGYLNDFRKVIVECRDDDGMKNLRNQNPLYITDDNVYYEYIPVTFRQSFIRSNLSPSLPHLCSNSTKFYNKLSRRSTLPNVYIWGIFISGLIILVVFAVVLSKIYLNKGNTSHKVVTLSLKSYQNLVEKGSYE